MKTWLKLLQAKNGLAKLFEFEIQFNLIRMEEWKHLNVKLSFFKPRKVQLVSWKRFPGCKLLIVMNTINHQSMGLQSSICPSVCLFIGFAYFSRRSFSVLLRWVNAICRILHMTPVALPQHRAGAGPTSPGSQFQELRIV